MNRQKIKVLRANKINNSNKDIQLANGQPFYERSTKHLYIGTGDTLGNSHSIIAEHADITNQDSASNAKVDFSIGDGRYTKTVDNVAHSTQATTLITSSTGWQVKEDTNHFLLFIYNGQTWAKINPNNGQLTIMSLNLVDTL